MFLKTEMDFGKVDNILISQAEQCVLAPGWHHINVVLYASSVSQTTPLIFGYLFKMRLKQAKSKNNLKHWKFINKNLKESEH